uniref:Ig-like domain-containing protein n=1 Tax=Pelusios castaneus TaxID=367368 RepID=A0A8C8SPE6_9SAUR
LVAGAHRTGLFSSWEGPHTCTPRPLVFQFYFVYIFLGIYQCLLENILKQDWAAQAMGAEYMQEKTQKFWRYEEDLSARAELSPSLTGFHTEQVHVGCALHGKVPMDPKFQYAYDGKDFISFDNQTGTWVAAVQPAFPQKQRWETSKTWSQYERRLEDCGLFSPTRHRLRGAGLALYDHRRERRDLMSVLVSYTDSPDGSVTLSCRARGFYPRPIHISWVRDGEDVMTETDSSGILPNADGTYYTQSSLEISPQQEDRHRYACRVEHGSLGEPTLIWVPGKKGPLTPGVLAAIALAALILAGAVGAGVILWRRKSAGESRSLWSWGWACHRPPRRAHGHGTGPIPIAWACWGRSGLC